MGECLRKQHFTPFTLNHILEKNIYLSLLNKMCWLIPTAVDTEHTVCADGVALRLHLTAERKYSRCIYVYRVILNIYTGKKDLKSEAHFGIAGI
jgi:hypothetical protein